MSELMGRKISVSSDFSISKMCAFLIPLSSLMALLSLLNVVDFGGRSGQLAIAYRLRVERGAQAHLITPLGRRDNVGATAPARPLRKTFVPELGTSTISFTCNIISSAWRWVIAFKSTLISNLFLVLDTCLMMRI